MSRLISSTLASWSGVSTYGKASSSSRCHGVSGPNACPFVACLAAYSLISSAAILIDARQLVRRLDVREGVLELTLPRRVRTERVPLRRLPGRVQLDQLRRDLDRRSPAGPASRRTGRRPRAHVATACPDRTRAPSSPAWPRTA